MKMIYRLIGIFCVATLLLSGCKPDIDGELGEPFNKVKGLEGTWTLSSFVQKDMNNPVKEERDFSSFYIISGEEPLSITFQAADRSYDVDITNGKNFFGEAGTWKFDNDAFPTFLIFEEGENSNEFALGSVVREFDNQLTLELEKGCDGSSPYVIYKFNFDRAE